MYRKPIGCTGANTLRSGDNTGLVKRALINVHTHAYGVSFSCFELLDSMGLNQDDAYLFNVHWPSDLLDLFISRSGLDVCGVYT